MTPVAGEEDRKFFLDNKKPKKTKVEERKDRAIQNAKNGGVVQAGCVVEGC